AAEPARRAVGLPPGAGDAAARVAPDLDLGRVEPVPGAVTVFTAEGFGDHHALAQQVAHRLVAAHQARVAHQLVVEAEIQQVQDGMLDATDVLVHGQPVVGAPVDLGVRAGAGVARVVPARLHEGVEGVGFAFGRLAAGRAGGP